MSNTLHRALTHRIAPGILLASSIHCAQGSDPSPRARAAPVAAPDDGATRTDASDALVARCGQCHGRAGDGGTGLLAGRWLDDGGGYAPNLTPDPETGLGRWSDAEILTAVRLGLDPHGTPLCGTMPRFANLSAPESLTLLDRLRALVPERRAREMRRCPSIAVRDASTDVGTDATSPDAARCPVEPRINELRTQGPNGSSDEYVEIYNASTACTLDLAGWSLRYTSASGTSPTTRWSGRAGDAIAPQGFALIVAAGYSGPGATLRFTSSTGVLASSGGAIGLFDPDERRVDAVGYGDATRSPLTESHAAPVPPALRVLARRPDGHDTDDHARDFGVAEPTPGTSNH